MHDSQERYHECFILVFGWGQMKVNVALQREATLLRGDVNLDHGKARLSTIRQTIADRQAARQFMKRQKELVRTLEGTPGCPFMASFVLVS